MALLGLVLFFVLISTDPPRVLFGLFVLYALSGYAMWLWNTARRRAPAERTPR